MHIILSPLRDDRPLRLSRHGDVLTIDGQAFDFGPLPAGASLPPDAIACDRIAGHVRRSAAGALTVPLVLPHGPNAPEQSRFPQQISLTEDGVVTLPPHDRNDTSEDPE